MKMNKLSSAIALLIPFNLYAFAPGFDIHGGGGISSMGTSHGSIVVTNSETDTLQNSDHWNAATGMLGIGMAFPLLSNGNNFLSTARLELNAYHTSHDVGGSIYRFGDADLADYNYQMSVRSTRLMADAVFNVGTFNRTSLFLKGGIGGSWNSASYREVALGVGGCDDNTIGMSSDTHGKFAVEGGVGVQYNFTNQLGLSLEYLYTHIGDVSTGNAVATGCLSAIHPAHFDFNIQSVLLALHYTFA